MLSKEFRYDLRHDPDFFARAQAVQSRFFTVLYSLAKDASSPSPLSFAIIVKKTVASGVQRSQIKRKVRQALSQALPSPLPDFEAPHAVVVLPRRNANKASVLELTQDLATTFSHLF